MARRGTGTSGGNRTERSDPYPTGRGPIPVATLLLVVVALTGLALPASAGTPAGAITSSGDGPSLTSVDVAAIQETGPTARLALSPSPASLGEAVTLDATASTTGANGNVEQCSFDTDGDGSYETTTQSCLTERTYDEPGEYTVSVQVATSAGQTANANETLTVRENERPRPAIAVDPETPGPGDVVQLSGVASTDPDGQIVAYTWTVDGRQVTGSTVEISFGDSGQYEISLTVEDDGGASATTSTTVDVRSNQPPTAELLVDPGEPIVGDAVSLDASASTDPDGAIVEYRWDLDGDGEVDRRTSAPETSITAADAGDRTVRVTVVDDRDVTDTATVDLAVSPAATTSANANGGGDVDRAEPTGGTVAVALDRLDPGLIPLVPDWLVVILLGLAVTGVVAHRREPIPARVDELRERVHRGEFRRNVAEKGVGFVAKSLFKRLFRGVADVVEGTGNVVGGAFEWIGRAIKQAGRRIANVLRRIGG